MDTFTASLQSSIQRPKASQANNQSLTSLGSIHDSPIPIQFVRALVNDAVADLVGHLAAGSAVAGLLVGVAGGLHLFLVPAGLRALWQGCVRMAESSLLGHGIVTYQASGGALVARARSW